GINLTCYDVVGTERTLLRHSCGRSGGNGSQESRIPPRRYPTRAFEPASFRVGSAWMPCVPWKDDLLV
ncbi:MAG: hypothetical protein ACTSUE_23900, partial [Promethearchaeota archaeon]